MIKDITQMGDLMKHHIEASRIYGKISDYERLLLKRTINSAFYILECLANISFEELELAIYMKVQDKELLQFMKLYEYQLEEAKLHREKFINGLHAFYMKTAFLIIENNPRNYFDFLDFVMRKSREKREYNKAFNGYMSLLLEQYMYIGYLKGQKEKICCGITTDNELMFVDDIFPYSDCASYDMEKELYNAFTNKGDLNFKEVIEAYKKYGYTIKSLTDVEGLDAKSRLYTNNVFILSSYINEFTKQILPTTEYKHIEPKYPRKWASTEVYTDILMCKRKYVLPSEGVIAEYFNTGCIEKILFQEIYKNNKIILLYKVFDKLNGEYSGYFDTKTGDFFSVYEETNMEEYHEQLKNFILENYYYLTCDLSIEGKKLSVLKLVDDIKHIDSYYGKQPVVCYLYKKKDSKVSEHHTGLRHYDRDNYKAEKIAINGFIRRLPLGWTASDEAKQLALQLGYELSENETFVRPFEKNVLKINEI
jgi:hypothetical protein